MTITRSAASTAFQRFDTCAQNAPAGVYEDAKDIREMIGNIADRIISEAKERNLTVCNCDGAFNLEVEIYGYLRAQNEDRFLSAEGYGKTWDEAGPDFRRRINANLTSDKDFLEKMRAERELEQAVEREALPYSFARLGDKTV